jgi:hypothetical protein
VGALIAYAALLAAAVYWLLELTASALGRIAFTYEDRSP